LVLSAAQFSEVYACLVILPRQVIVRQLDDGPPILINGQPAHDATLSDGDRLAAGPFEFLVHIDVSLENHLVNYENSARATNRCSTTTQVANSIAMRAAARLIQDIRAALDEERRVMRRPA
jgi:hypothetical protein